MSLTTGRISGICPCGAPNCNSEHHRNILAGRDCSMWDLGQAEIGQNQHPVLTFVDSQPVWVEDAPVFSEGIANGLSARLESGHFRLLRILPPESNSKNELECVVSNFRLPGAGQHSDTLAYVAISYCWGQDPGTTRIMVSDEHVDIRANLYRLLIKLRTLGYQDWIWVDALCIKQNDDQEKSHQIPQMDKIFQGATLTLGWLGEGSGRFGITIDGWKSWVSEIRDWYTKAVRQSYKSLADAQKQISPFVLDETFARYLVYIFGNPYWKRLWILQETVLPASLLILCDNHLFEWEELHVLAGYIGNLDILSPAQASSAIQRSAQLGASTINYLGELRSLYHGGLPHDTVPYIASLLQHAQSRKSSFDADHVNGILGLLSQKHRDAFEVDVTRSSAQTFVHFTASLLKTYGWTSVDLLRRAGLRKYNNSRLPSWAINLARPTPTVSLRMIAQPTFQVGNIPSLFNSQSIHVDTDRGKLTVTGLPCEVIATVVPFKSQVQHFSKDVTVCVAVYEALSKCLSATCAITGCQEDSILALATTLSGACSLGSSDPTTEYNIWTRRLQMHMTGHESHQGSCSEFALNEFGAGIAKACRGRSFSTTTSGRIGLCPELADTGDEIVVMCGCSTLMAIREHAAGEFSLLGEVFCDGLNFGELADVFEQSGWEAREYVLI